VRQGPDHRRNQRHLADVYGARVSKETISKITDAVVAEMTEWLNRQFLEQLSAKRNHQTMR
jgi:transposase-like protein